MFRKGVAVTLCDLQHNKKMQILKKIMGTDMTAVYKYLWSELDRKIPRRRKTI